MTIRGKKIFRSIGDRRLAGVCGGFGEYLEVDPVLVRLVWIVVTCMTGVLPGIVGYLAAWLIVPEEPMTVCTPQPNGEQGA